MALDDVTDGNRDRLARVGHCSAADESVGGLHGDGADQVVTEVLCNLERQRLGDRGKRDLGVQGVEQFRNSATREFNVHDGTDDPHDAAGYGRSRTCPVVFGYCCGHVLVTSCARGERVGAADDLADFLGDLGLASLVA